MKKVILIFTALTMLAAPSFAETPAADIAAQKQEMQNAFATLQNMMTTAMSCMDQLTNAANQNAAKDAPKTGNEKKEVKEAFAAWRAALSGGDAQKIVDLYADDAVLLATLHNDPIVTQGARLKYFEGLVTKKDMKATVDEEMVRVLDSNTAMVNGVYTFSFEEDGKVTKIPARYTYVFEKENDKWMIVVHHSSKLPL
jgi:uncharacterized protein (TIGR02246 family)